MENCIEQEITVIHAILKYSPSEIRDCGKENSKPLFYWCAYGNQITHTEFLRVC